MRALSKVSRDDVGSQFEDPQDPMSMAVAFWEFLVDLEKPRRLLSRSKEVSVYKR